MQKEKTEFAFFDNLLKYEKNIIFFITEKKKRLLKNPYIYFYIFKILDNKTTFSKQIWYTFKINITQNYKTLPSMRQM